MHEKFGRVKKALEIKTMIILSPLRQGVLKSILCSVIFK